jgi:hypothetical protein
MRKTLEVIDDFYKSPLEYRERALKSVALSQCAEKSHICGGPGTNDSLDDDEATSRILQILRQGEVSVSRATVCGYFTCRGEDARNPPAMLLEGFDWVGLVCLPLPEWCSGSIWFYRREQSPLCDPATAVPLGGLGDSAGNRLDVVSNPQSLRQAEAYEGTIYLPMRFNRMFLFQASALGYGVNPGFEKTSESELLVQVLAFS